MKPRIVQSKSGEMKRRSYQENISRMRRALRSEFYFEGLVICYALMEDRLRSYLYHIGVFAGRNDTKAYGPAAAIVRAMLREQAHDDNKGLHVLSFQGKLEIIEATLQWYDSLGDERPRGNWEARVWSQYRRHVKTSDLRATITELRPWCGLRNEVVHGLMSKDVDALEARMPVVCSEGERLFRRMDAYVDQVKYGHAIRRSLGLPTEKW